jgi:hypothetical protein
LFLHNENTIEKIELFFEFKELQLNIKRFPVINLIETISKIKYNAEDQKLLCLNDRKDIIYILKNEKIITKIKYDIENIKDFREYDQFILAINNQSQVEIRSLTKCTYRRNMEQSIDVHYLPKLDLVLNINLNLQLEVYLKSKNILLDIITCNDFHEDLANCFNFLFKYDLNELIILENNNILRFFEIPENNYYESFFNKEKVKSETEESKSYFETLNTSESKKNLLVKIESYFKSINKINIDKNRLTLLEDEMVKLKELVILFLFLIKRRKMK